MHDVGYVAVGYSLTLVALVGYRWRLAVRTRRARQHVSAVSPGVSDRRRRA